MGIKKSISVLLVAPIFLFTLNGFAQLESDNSENFVKTTDTIPKKEVENKVTNLEKRALKIFPNPVKEVLIIGTLGSKNDAANVVQIFDNLGQLVHQNSSIAAENNQIKIKTESLKPGVYYLKVNKGSISKFIKIL